METIRDFFVSRYRLSDREAEVANIVCGGLSNKSVAEKLHICEKTVKFHLTNIFKKVGVKSRSQLIVLTVPALKESKINSES